MGLLDIVWHVSNLFAPAIGVGVLASVIVKLLWRRRLTSVNGLSLGAWAVGAASMALVVGLAVLGRDGRVATYALMVASTALVLWWAGFKSPR